MGIRATYGCFNDSATHLSHWFDALRYTTEVVMQRDGLSVDSEALDVLIPARDASRWVGRRTPRAMRTRVADTLTALMPHRRYLEECYFSRRRDDWRFPECSMVHVFAAVPTPVAIALGLLVSSLSDATPMIEVGGSIAKGTREPSLTVWAIDSNRCTKFAQRKSANRQRQGGQRG